MTSSDAPTLMLWVGTYTSDSGRDGVGIGAVRVAAASGLPSGSVGSGVGLEWLGVAVVASSPSFLAVHPELPVVYAAQEADQTVLAYRRAGPTSLEPFGDPWPAGSAVCHVAVDRDARFLTAACWGDGRVLLYELAPNGAICSRSEAAPANDPYSALALAAVPLEGQAPRQSRAHASLMLSDGRVMTTDLGFDLVRVWRYESGALALDHEIVLPFGSGPRHLVQHPDGTVFVVTEYSVEVVALRSPPPASAADASTAVQHSPGVALPRFAVAAIGPATALGVRPGDAAAEIALSPDARFVYVSVRGSNRISTLEVDAPGCLRPIADVPSGGDWPRHHVVVRLPSPAPGCADSITGTAGNAVEVAVPARTTAASGPSSAALLVAHERSDDIALFTLDPASGIPRPHRGSGLVVAAPTALIPSLHSF